MDFLCQELHSANKELPQRIRTTIHSSRKRDSNIVEFARKVSFCQLQRNQIPSRALKYLEAKNVVKYLQFVLSLSLYHQISLSKMLKGISFRGANSKSETFIFTH